MKRIIWFLIAACLLCACRGESLKEDFSNYEDIRVVYRGNTVFRYNPLTCQTGFNRERCEFRLCTDNMSDFVSLKLDAIPAERGQRLSGDVSWTTRDNVSRKKNVSFEVIRSEADRFWLWSSSARLGAVVRILD